MRLPHGLMLLVPAELFCAVSAGANGRGVWDSCRAVTRFVRVGCAGVNRGGYLVILRNA